MKGGAVVVERRKPVLVTEILIANEGITTDSSVTSSESYKCINEMAYYNIEVSL